ncbi:hypothetical protein Tco_0199762 [Tanacetum coccineum]
MKGQKKPASTSAPSEKTTKTAGKTTSTGSKTHKKSASQSAPVEEAMQSTDVFEGPTHQEFETGRPMMNKQKKRPTSPELVFNKPYKTTFSDHA